MPPRKNVGRACEACEQAHQQSVQRLQRDHEDENEDDLQRRSLLVYQCKQLRGPGVKGHDNGSSGEQDEAAAQRDGSEQSRVIAALVVDGDKPRYGFVETKVGDVLKKEHDGQRIGPRAEVEGAEVPHDQHLGTAWSARRRSRVPPSATLSRGSASAPPSEPEAVFVSGHVLGIGVICVFINRDARGTASAVTVSGALAPIGPDAAAEPFTSAGRRQ